MQMPMNANKTLLTAAMVMSLFATMSCTNTTGTKDNNKPETSINREARQAEGTDELIRQRYDGCRILDHDYDNGYLEVKIVHDGTEKVALFDGSSRWVRTLWETRRERLPERVIEAIGQEGLAYEDIDDNDNKVVDSPGGLLYAVQARRHNDDFIFLVSPDGKIMSTLTADEWNDGRTYYTPRSRPEGSNRPANLPAVERNATATATPTGLQTVDTTTARTISTRETTNGTTVATDDMPRATTTTTTKELAAWLKLT